MADSLVQLLAIAQAAPIAERINHRDAIARYGDAAIDAVAPWLTDHRLGRFGAQVIWKAGELGARDKAIAVLREALDDPTVVPSREDIAMLLGKLGWVPPRAPTYRSKPGSIPLIAGTGWAGFQPREFETTDGTFWRSRGGKDSMVPHVLRPLRDVDAMFESWSIYHSPEVHLAVKDRYEQEGDRAQGFRAAKLVVYAYGPNLDHPDAQRKVTAGLYIERGEGSEPYGAVDGRWDWPEFVRLLRTDAFRASLQHLMAVYGMSIGDYFAGSRYREGSGVVHGLVASLDQEVLVVRRDGRIIGRGWDAFSDELDALPGDVWQNIHLWRSWPAEDAIRAGVGFARMELVPLLRDVAVVYLRIVAPHRAVRGG
jgi:hypothetical protein